MTPASTPTVPFISTHSVTVRDAAHGAALFATRAFARGERILLIEGRTQRSPTRYSIQLDTNVHIEADGDLASEEMRVRHPWRFLNHACDPVARVSGDALYALRAIAAGDEITFDYTTTEAEMAEPFDCVCASPRCVGRVQGFLHLPQREQFARRTHLAPHILRLLESIEKSGLERTTGANQPRA